MLSIITSPSTAAAYVIETDYEYPQVYYPSATSSSVSSVSTDSSISPVDQKWNDRRARNQGFWADMMNHRKAEADFKEHHTARREERRLKRLECRTDIRKAGRGAMMPITLKCFAAVLTTELEILRKEKQYLSTIPGPSEQYINGAMFHIESLSDAISTIIRSIDSEFYEEKSAVQDAKEQLGSLYRENKRLAMTKLRVSKSLAWINHLIIRLDNARLSSAISEPVRGKIREAIDCFETQEDAIKSLLSLDDNDALIERFRQEQSNVKFCIHSARDAAKLNTELEQADAKNS